MPAQEDGAEECGARYSMRVPLQIGFTHACAYRISQHCPSLDAQGHAKLFKGFGASRVIWLVERHFTLPACARKLDHNQLEMRREQGDQFMPHVIGHTPPMYENERRAMTF